MIKVEIKKPIFSKEGHIRVGIRDIYIKKALNSRTYLEISTPDGSAIIDPRRILKEGEKLSQIFKYPDSPMILYHFTFLAGEKPEIKEMTEEEKLKQLSLASS